MNPFNEQDPDNKVMLSHLTVRDIHASLRGHLIFPNHVRNNKQLLIQHVLEHAPRQQLQDLLDQAQLKRGEDAKRVASRHSSQKRKRDISRESDAEQQHGSELSPEEPHVQETFQFLQLPRPAKTKQCYARFYAATSNEVVELCVCGVCARECSIIADRVMAMPLTLMPNSSRLIPSVKHPAHHLYCGRLLEPAGLVGEEMDPIVSICQECLEELNKPGSLPPKMSLANSLWIGNVPWQLEVLTFPEQLLIAQLYPRVYVFKLFPKQQGARHETLQRAMRGNVSTYELNMDAIASMLEGKLMPRPPSILASLISVTFVAVHDLPRKWIHSTFRVRHKVVAEALWWLKKNNPKYYGDIDISPTRIDSLPEDDIPEELISIIRQSDDTVSINEENDGYVPEDDVESELKGAPQQKITHDMTMCRGSRDIGGRDTSHAGHRHGRRSAVKTAFANKE